MHVSDIHSLSETSHKHQRRRKVPKINWETFPSEFKFIKQTSNNFCKCRRVSTKKNPSTVDWNKFWQVFFHTYHVSPRRLPPTYCVDSRWENGQMEGRERWKEGVLGVLFHQGNSSLEIKPEVFSSNARNRNFSYKITKLNHYENCENWRGLRACGPGGRLGWALGRVCRQVQGQARDRRERGWFE